jgi:single-stranded-DNA-specific exonuclease
MHRAVQEVFPDFNLYEAIHACKDHLLGYGGHFAAAGMTLKTANIEAFRLRFEEVVASTIDPDMLIPEIVIDAGNQPLRILPGPSITFFVKWSHLVLIT